MYSFGSINWREIVVTEYSCRKSEYWDNKYFHLIKYLPMYAPRNTGKYVSDNNREIGEDLGYKISKENDRIDLKYGFERVKDTNERTGYLINMHSVSTKSRNPILS